ncbi:coiled-coil domain-containing protein 194 [Sceloporus undulatus]|uniref:coiled-coil domain-containing protein 194 n=1 Tax=Sceloporus undulatus TaxID=8520 RepID=UPI001C4DA4C6|nr:coiled-coil domain-containing protein 194 [Sceloporus undulatus]
MVWHSEAARQLKGCQERITNETTALRDRVAELEEERARQRKQLERLVQREKDLQKQLSQAKEGRKTLNATLTDCLENMTRLDANLSALHHELLHLQAEEMEMDSQNGALLVQMAQWQGKAAELGAKLEEATEAQMAANAEKEHCHARESALQESVRSYLAEIASLQCRLQARSSSSSSRRKGPPFRYIFWGMAIFCILFPLEGLSFLFQAPAKQ